MKILVLLLLFIPYYCFSQVFLNPSALSTGQGIQGNLDPIWQTSNWFNSLSTNSMGLTYNPAYISNNCAPGAWVNPTTLPAPINNGNWISSSLNQCTGQVGYMSFRLTLNLPADCNGLNIANENAYTLFMSGYVDNQLVDIRINGLSENLSNLPGGNYSPGGQVDVMINGPWNIGVNYIDFIVRNDGGPYGLLMVANLTMSSTIDTDGDGISDIMDLCPCDFGLNQYGCTSGFNINNCEIDTIRQVFHDAGCIELFNCYDSCSMYFLNPLTLTGDQAQNFAQNFGANLVSIQSLSENNCIIQNLNELNQSGIIWIGYNDNQNEGNFEWYDHSTTSFTNWGPGEPNNAGNSGANENCVQIYSNGLWNDYACDVSSSQSIIEVNLCPVATIDKIQLCGSSEVELIGGAYLGSTPYVYSWFEQSSGFNSTNQTINYSIVNPVQMDLNVIDRYNCQVQNSIIINAYPSLYIGADHCFDGNEIIETTNGFNSYLWQNGDTNQSIPISAPGQYYCTATFIGENLVENGDFELGDSGFTSEYNYINNQQGGYIISDSNSVSWWANCPNHTQNGELMMIADAACGTNGILGGASVWCQTVDVIPNTDYIISFWITNAGNDPNLTGSNFQININNSNVGTNISTSPAICNWNQYYQIWNSGSNTIAEICINETTMSCVGSDFAMDDIYFAQYCQFIDTIEIFDKPIASFNFQNSCLNDSTQFINTSTINNDVIQSSFWDFGDSYYSNSYSNNHLYLNSNLFNVNLIVTSQNGCSDTSSNQVSVWPNPVSNYVSDTVCFGETTNFNSTSTVNNSIFNSSIDSLIWVYPTIFDYGLTSQYFYQSTGNNAGPLLIVYSNFGCIDSIVKNVVINELPVSQITAFDECQGEEINFDATSSLNGMNFTWDLNDGNFSNEISFNHLYSNSGVYNVQLIVEDAKGCIDTATHIINVYSKPIANFSYQNICRNDSVFFQDLSSLQSVLNDSIINWDWNFGDGNTSDFQNPINNFNIDSIYNVNLIITTNYNCVDTVSNLITVWPLPIADFDFTNVCENQISLFTDLTVIESSNFINSWVWNFGDNNYSNLQNPNHSYLVDSTFQVNLIVTTNNGCLDSIRKNVYVYPISRSIIIGQDLIGCSPVCSKLIVNTIENDSSNENYSWIIPNIGAFNNDSLYYCFDNSSYNETKYYDIQLITNNSFGCSDTVNYDDYITVYPTPLSEFNFTPQNPTIIDNQVQFLNNSIGASFFYWIIDTLYSSNLFEPLIEFPHLESDYQIIQIATNEFGCIDTSYNVIKINNELVVYVPNTFTPDGDEFNNDFKPIFSISNIEKYNFQIYNRWGELIFYSDNIYQGWDGTFKGGLVQEGSYAWEISYKNLNNAEIVKINGHINVLK